MTTQIPSNLKLGSNTGNAVLFTGALINRYSKDSGYYGIITGWRPAGNYNMMACYYVDVFKNGQMIDSITTTWSNLTDKS